MTKTKLLLHSFLAIFLSIGLFSCGSDDDVVVDPPVEEMQNIAEIAAADAQFSTLVSALDRVGLVSTLEGDGPFTVFAPTNAAFEALGVNLDDLTDEQLTDILLYHVLGAQVNAGDIAEGQTYATTASTASPGNKQLSILIENTSGAVAINGAANVTAADVEATNGVIHVIDAVITPLDVVGHAAANSNFSSLVGALSTASGDLVSVLQGDGPFTVFAPVNTAFDEISDVVAGLSEDDLSGVLTYHVVSGANVVAGDLVDGMQVETVNGGLFTINLGDSATITDAQGNVSDIVLTDVQGTNGVIHVLNKVILP